MERACVNDDTHVDCFVGLSGENIATGIWQGPCAIHEEASLGTEKRYADGIGFSVVECGL